jgi:hypothetical protein
MEDRQHDDTLGFGAKIHAIREAAGDDATGVCAGNGELEGIVCSLRDAALDLGHELESETTLLSFIPCARLDEFGACGAKE